MPDPAELAVRLHEALKAAGIPHAVGGAIAFGFHAEPRSTVDIDLNLFVSEAELSRVLDILQGAGCVMDRQEALRSARERGDFIAHLDGYRVDAFHSFHAFHEEVRRRVQHVPFLGKSLPILSAEDLVVFKVLFDRPKDWLDIARLAAARKLDNSYVSRWTRALIDPGDERLIRLEKALG